MNAQLDRNAASRQFNLGDGLILMGALALSLERFRAVGWFQAFPNRIASCWQAISQLAGWSPWVTHISFTRRDLMIEVTGILTEELLLRTLCPVLFGLMVAQPLMRLRRPRPPLARLVRQSGFATCLTCIALAVGMMFIVGDWWFSELSLSLPLTRTIVLLLIWPILGLRPWIAERSWIDRLGRAVGCGWIVAMASVAALDFLGR